MPQMKPLLWFIIMPFSIIFLSFFFFFMFYSLKKFELNFNYISPKYMINWSW